MKLIHMSVENFLKEVDSNTPAPGGGSVAALASTLGASLTRMVGHLTLNKKKYKELDENIKIRFEETFDMFANLKDELEKLIDKDTDAYNLVMDAYKLPKETEEDKKIRVDEIQKSLKLAIYTPLEICRLSLKGLYSIEPILEYGNSNAITDLGVAAIMFLSGIEGGILNVKVNLSSITDEEFRAETLKEIDKIYNDAVKKKIEILKVVNTYLV